MDKLKSEIDLLHARICKALASPNRIMILYTLAEHAYNVSELAEAIELPQSTVSRHLTVLRERRLVVANREGQSVYYSLVDNRILEALDLLRAVLAERLDTQSQLAESVYKNLEEE
ncbi:MAG: HTH-type transcriptional regulator NmtR [Chloroflexi bacterium]|nr:HTH-type transcriptional regulator NmtR [Chloroflexota bacterium]